MKGLQIMKDFYYYIKPQEMPLDALSDWLNISYKNYDREYIKLFEREFKRRGLKPIYE